MHRLIALFAFSSTAFAADPNRLDIEVHHLGWIAYAQKSTTDWDLHASRPDGTDNRNLTNTKDLHEFDPQWSPDGAKLLFRRLKVGEAIDPNNHGRQGELVLADADGTNPTPLGNPGEFPWASWSPDGKQIACLTPKGILIVDLATKKTVRTLERKGFFQQMTWSPDGLSLVGVSNGLGTAWAIGRMQIATGEVNAVSRVDCCTPDWAPDSKKVVYSHRPVQLKDKDGKDWTQLWLADSDGKNARLLFAKEKQHIYGGCISPDGKYVLFTGNINEDGDPTNAGSLLRLMRLADAPIIGEDSPTFLKAHPKAKPGPILPLHNNTWEPCWTAKDIFPKAKP